MKLKVFSKQRELEIYSVVLRVSLMLSLLFLKQHIPTLLKVMITLHIIE